VDAKLDLHVATTFTPGFSPTERGPGSAIGRRALLEPIIGCEVVEVRLSACQTRFMDSLHKSRTFTLALHGKNWGRGAVGFARSFAADLLTLTETSFSPLSVSPRPSRAHHAEPCADVLASWKGSMVAILGNTITERCAIVQEAVIAAFAFSNESFRSSAGMTVVDQRSR